MDDDELPAESATTISRSLLILLFTNTIFLQQKCNVSDENKNFSADGSEYNAVVDFLLLT